MINPDILEIIDAATKAQSAHNTQPWKFSVNGFSIEIHPDLTHKTPVADPDGRELYISIGCATENLCLAAMERHYSPTFSMHESDGNVFIKVNLTKDESQKANSLASAIPHRHTNRMKYNGQLIPDEVIAQLCAVENEKGVKAYFFKHGEKPFDWLTNLVKHSNYVLYNNFAFKKELLQWIRFNKRHAMKTLDGLTYNSLGFPPIPSFLGSAIAYSQLKPQVQIKDYQQKILSSSHLVLFTVQGNQPTDWIYLGIYLERMLLKMHLLGISSTYLNQPCELPEFVDEIKTHLSLTTETPHILLRIGFSRKAVLSPRRSIEAVMEC